MGFYDVNCAITSICLGPGEAVLVPLRRLGPERHRAIGLPLKGQYNRLGAIDLDELTPAMELLVEFFTGLDDHRLELRDDDAAPLSSDVGSVVGWLERNTTVWSGYLMEEGGPPMVSLDGDPLVFALVSTDVWDAIVAAGPPDLSSTPPSALLAELAGDDPVLVEIYGADVDRVAVEIRELAAVDRFLRARALPWKTHVEGEVDFGAQQSADDLQWWLQWAYGRHGADPVLRAGLDAHALDVERMRREEDEWGREEAEQRQAESTSPSLAELAAQLEATVIETAIGIEPPQRRA